MPPARPIRPRRAALLLVPALAAALAASAPALGHSDVTATSPRDGAVLAEAPGRVERATREVTNAESWWPEGRQGGT